jgi:hypothetical protein
VRQGGGFDFPIPGNKRTKLARNHSRAPGISDIKKLAPAFRDVQLLCPRARLSTPHARNVFEKIFDYTRQWYGFHVAGYVVMPQHVLQQTVARRLPRPEGGPLWQPRYYDFNVWSYAKQFPWYDALRKSHLTSKL